ncbi:MAG: hypothetical protein COA53_04820 [Rhodobacteraceae bacterium]|nr:MAG: hypothetical protein COA53_04820 [Paracoccaceae bacterium]
MKRDLDRIRGLLIEIEESDNSRFRVKDGQLSGESKGSPWSDFDLHHISLMWEAKLIREARMLGEFPETGEFFTISWDGYEYLDSVRDDGIWAKTKEKLLLVGGSASLDVTKSVAISMITAALA